MPVIDCGVGENRGVKVEAIVSFEGFTGVPPFPRVKIGG